MVAVSTLCRCCCYMSTALNRAHVDGAGYGQFVQLVALEGHCSLVAGECLDGLADSLTMHVFQPLSIRDMKQNWQAAI